MAGPSWFLLAWLVAAVPAGVRGRIGVVLVVVVFSVCLWSGWLLFRYPGTLLARLDITNFITKPLTRMGIYVVAIFFGVPGGLGVAV